MLIKSQNFINTVNNEDNQFVIVFPFFMIRVVGENEEWWHFGFYQDWRNQYLILKDLIDSTPDHSNKNKLKAAVRK